MLEIAGKSDIQHGDGFWITCKKCGTETKNKWLRDPIVMRFKATCEECKESRDFKLDVTRWSGWS